MMGLFWILFLAALLGGLVMAMPAMIPTRFLPLLLAFSGGYLLAITLLHLLPELFAFKIASLHIGSYILIGFFVQRIIEVFSRGVEHGHTMAAASNYCCSKHHKIFPFLVCIALHAFLDGTILVHSQHLFHCNAAQRGLVMGMLLHKTLEAFAFMSVLRGFSLSLGSSLRYLVLFSFASPLGLWMSDYIKDYLSAYGSMMLLAIVTGNFLYIAATIFFEASPNHCSNPFTFWISLLGAGLAASIEFLG